MSCWLAFEHLEGVGVSSREDWGGGMTRCSVFPLLSPPWLLWLGLPLLAWILLSKLLPGSDVINTTGASRLELKITRPLSQTSEQEGEKEVNRKWGKERKQKRGKAAKIRKKILGKIVPKVQDCYCCWYLLADREKIADRDQRVFNVSWLHESEPIASALSHCLFLHIAFS